MENLLGANVKVEWDLSNYGEKKADLKSATRGDASPFAKKVDLASLTSNVDEKGIDILKNMPTNLSNLKSKLDKLDIGRLDTTPVDLRKLSNIVKNKVVKKTEYNELVKKINNISTTDTSNLVKKTDYNTNISEKENKITTDRSEYIATREFNKLTSLTSRKICWKIKTSKFRTQNWHYWFRKKKDFNNKLKSFNKIITSNKTRYVEIKTKLDDLEKMLK